MVFPIADDNRDRTSFPVVNVCLIAINVFVFVVLQGMGTNQRFTYAFATVPAEISQGKDITTPAREIVRDTPAGPQRIEAPGLQPTPIPVYLTLLTAIFMHGGIAHIAGNMWFLWIFGDNIEHDLGRVRYLLFYLICGLLASLAHVMVSLSGESSLIPCLGASGAISGVLGGYLILHPRRTVTVLLFRVMTQVPGWVAVGIWFVFQILASVMGMEAGVAHAAHIGGFIAGLILIKPFTIGRPRPEMGREKKEYEREGGGWV